MTLGKRIAELRNGLKLSQGGLAKLINVSRGYIGLIEIDRSIPSDDTFQLLAEALQTTTADLLQARGLLPGGDLAVEVARFAHLINGYPEPWRAWVLEMAALLLDHADLDLEREQQMQALFVTRHPASAATIPTDTPDADARLRAMGEDPTEFTLEERQALQMVLRIEPPALRRKVIEMLAPTQLTPHHGCNEETNGELAYTSGSAKRRMAD